MDDIMVRWCVGTLRQTRSIIWLAAQRCTGENLMKLESGTVDTSMTENKGKQELLMYMDQ